MNKSQKCNCKAAYNAHVPHDADCQSLLTVATEAPVAYVCEHATYPDDNTRFVALERPDHSKDFVCRPLFYAIPARSVAREALEHIVEYWNRDRNEDAMYDALEHMIETAAQALESEAKTSEPSAIYDPAYVREKFADYQSQIDGLKEELEFVRKAANTQKLDKPAMVGGVRFGAGVKWSTVVDAAQRFYEYGVTPENEANRIARAQETVAYIRTGKTRPGGNRPVIDEDGLIGAAIDGDALIDAVFKRTIPFTYKSFGRALLAEAWPDKPKALTTYTRIPGELTPRQAIETAVAHAFGGKPVDPCDCIACVKMRGHQYGEI